MKNIVKKGLFSVLLAISCFSTTLFSLKRIPRDCYEVVFGFVEDQEDVFNGFGLTCKELKEAVDHYLCFFSDGRSLKVYYSSKAKDSVYKLFDKEQISHPLHLKFRGEISNKELGDFFNSKITSLYKIKTIDFEFKRKKYWLSITWESLPHLELLDLSSSDINGPSLIEILFCCKKLKKIDLSDCRGISEAAWEHIPWENVKDLEELNLRGTRFDANIMFENGRELVKEILSYCKKLKKINFDCDDVCTTRKLQEFIWENVKSQDSEGVFGEFPWKFEIIRSK